CPTSTQEPEDTPSDPKDSTEHADPPAHPQVAPKSGLYAGADRTDIPAGDPQLTHFLVTWTRHVLGSRHDTASQRAQGRPMGAISYRRPPGLAPRGSRVGLHHCSGGAVGSDRLPHLEVGCAAKRRHAVGVRSN